jgi:1-deoxy-D-xylulose-5-phosphate reductoisomerase
VDTIAEVMAAHHGVRSEGSLTIEDVLAADAWAREEATRMLETRS